MPLLSISVLEVRSQQGSRKERRSDEAMKAYNSFNECLN